VLFYEASFPYYEREGSRGLIRENLIQKIDGKILSSSNSGKEMDEKKKLYFAIGAKEFWTCDPQGKITIFDHSGMIAKSNIIEKFPDNITLE